MFENVVLYLFLGLFLGVIVSIFSVLLGKYLKGSLKIHLFKRNYNYEEEIRGTFTLTAKKSITGNDLSIHLIGYKREVTYSKGKRHTRSVEFTRFTQHIESNVRYEVGLKRDYEFAFQIPKYIEIFGDSLESSAAVSGLGKLSKYVLRPSRINNYTWQIRADLDAEGLDLSGKRDISITRAI